MGTEPKTRRYALILYYDMDADASVHDAVDALNRVNITTRSRSAGGVSFELVGQEACPVSSLRDLVNRGETK